MCYVPAWSYTYLSIVYLSVTPCIRGLTPRPNLHSLLYFSLGQDNLLLCMRHSIAMVTVALFPQLVVTAGREDSIALPEVIESVKGIEVYSLLPL